nr:uncharacterized mitochondrial protein AtMg00810-like [Tanacetum cinerariifolium]
CALGKSKKSSHQPKAEDTNQEKIYLLHMDLCGPMRAESINGKIHNVRTDNGTEFVNQTLREFYENVSITHQTSIARTPQQNGIVKRRNQTLVEAAHTITPYDLMHDKKPNLSILHVVGSLCYPTIKQLQADAMRCYFNAFLTSVEPKNYKEAMLEPSWIDAMQEELHEYERLQTKVNWLNLQGKPGNPTHYHRMIGSLMYVTSNRPDLVFVVCMCVRYQEKPIEKHLYAVKQIFQYLKGTIDMGLCYPKDSCITLTAYADADHAGC